MIREEFNIRKNEIDSIYEILKIVELENPELSAYNLMKEKYETLGFNRSKIDTLRSTAYLLLYNLIESTIYNSVTTIFDAIKDSQLKYFEIIEDVRKYWLNNMYKHDEKKKKETIIDTMMRIADQIFENTIELASNEISYGGSLDAQAIFATAKSMRINVNNLHKIYNKNTHGQTLIDIKQKRNWLAHGEKSFIEVERTTTFSQLKEAKEYITVFLNEFINSVESYIENKHFKIEL